MSDLTQDARWYAQDAMKRNRPSYSCCGRFVDAEDAIADAYVAGHEAAQQKHAMKGRDA